MYRNAIEYECDYSKFDKIVEQIKSDNAKRRRE